MSSLKDLIEQGRELSGDAISEDVVYDDDAYPSPTHTAQIPEMPNARPPPYNEGWTMGWGRAPYEMQPGEQNQNLAYDRGHGPYVRSGTVASAKLQNAQIYLKEAVTFLESAARQYPDNASFVQDELMDLSRTARQIHQRTLALAREMKG